MICLIYKLIFHSHRERADKSPRNNDTGDFFVKKGKSASEVDASVRDHRNGDAARTDRPGAYGDVWGDPGFLQMCAYSMSFYQ